MRLSSADPVRPLSPTLIKKKYEEAEKEKATNRFHFAIRTKADDRLVGFVRLDHIECNNGGGHVALGIGDANDRGHGYGAEALKLILRYAFAELNLSRRRIHRVQRASAALGTSRFSQAAAAGRLSRRQALGCLKLGRCETNGNVLRRKFNERLATRSTRAPGRCQL
jgi:hypothetical protein